MIDYDTQPVTPQVKLYGSRSSTDAYAIRDFLTRNRRLFDWFDVDGEAATDPALTVDTRLPLCVLPDRTRLEAATVERVASGLGMIVPPKLAEYDVAIAGAGPAGLAAAVYAASEGLRTAVIESVAPGGQAGTTSMIENYLGFPGGISGSQLASRATVQAEQFGAEILVARPLADITTSAGLYLSRLSDGTVIPARAVVAATGVQWRRLDVPGVERLLGAGVYYGAGPSEARACEGAGVVIVGGGNSAGQACLRFARYARQVTLLVRGPALGASMSQYLVDQVTAVENIEVRTSAEVAAVDGDARLRTLRVALDGGDRVQTTAADALFICIGGMPCTGGMQELQLVRDRAGYLVTGTDLSPGGGVPDGWPLARQPYPLETSLPGVFAAGDVRHGSMKRCAAATGEGAMAVALVHRYLAETGGE
ncbi:MAG TPA: FAD-dependent oxidoreductase [Candidatus Dormibacteraeota bacterium]|jgi:thioredoxin reductase (NADPH)